MNAGFNERHEVSPSSASLVSRNRWFSRFVIAAMLVDESLASFVRPPEVVHFTIVIGVSRGGLKTTYTELLK